MNFPAAPPHRKATLVTFLPNYGVHSATLWLPTNKSGKANGVLYEGGRILRNICVRVDTVAIDGVACYSIRAKVNHKDVLLYARKT